MASNINLISGRRADRVRQTRVVRGLLVGSLGTVVLGLSGVGYLTVRMIGARMGIEQAKAEIEKQRPIREEIAAAERERNVLLPKLMTLTQAQAVTQRWWDITEGFKRAVPQQTWLTGVNVEAGGGENPIRTLRLTGVTANQSRVGETMYRLNMQPEHYRRIDLRYAQAVINQVNQPDRVEFELAAQLQEIVTPPPGQPGAAPAGGVPGAPTQPGVQPGTPGQPGQQQAAQPGRPATAAPSTQNSGGGNASQAK